MDICIVRRVRLCSLCVGAFIVLVLVGCSVEIPHSDPSIVSQSRESMALYVTESSSPPTSLPASPTAEPEPIVLERDSADPAVIARLPVVYNALLYVRSHAVSEDERTGYYVPAGRKASILGVSADGGWLLVRHPVGVDGWIETNRLALAPTAIRQLMMASPSFADLVPTPTLFSAPPTAAPVALHEPDQPDQQPETVVQVVAVEPPTPTPAPDVPLPVITTFADGTADVVEMTAVQDAAIFAHPNPGASPEERTGYFVPAGQSVYAVGLADDRYWVHIVYEDAVQGWVSPSYFLVTSGDMGMLPSSDYRFVRNQTTATETTSLWRLPARPKHTE